MSRPACRKNRLCGHSVTKVRFTDYYQIKTNGKGYKRKNPEIRGFLFAYSLGNK